MITIGSEQKLRLGQLLLMSGAVSEGQLTEALRVQKTGGRDLLLGEILTEQGACCEEQVKEALAVGYGIPFARVSDRIADPKVIDILPRDFCRRHCILPLFKVRGVLTLAVSEPADIFLIEEVARKTACRVQIVCATSGDIRRTFRRRPAGENVFVIDAGGLAPAGERAGNRRDPQAAADPAVIRTVNQLIRNAVRQGASDIHIEPGEESLRVRYRVDGRLCERMRLPRKILPALVARAGIMAGPDFSGRHPGRDGTIHVMVEGRSIDLRVSTLNEKAGERLVIHVINNDRAPASLDKLGFRYETLEQWRRVIACRGGIALVAGPAGSGKTTMLYSVLRELAGDEVNICTVEDPIEFSEPRINQFQVNERIGFTFSAALWAVLRQDPDIIMVGRLHDPATARIALQAALAGRLVLAGLHADDAAGAVGRLVGMGVEPYLVSASVAGILAQRLVRKICTNCKEPYDPPAGDRRAFEHLAAEEHSGRGESRPEHKVETFYHGAGCDQCRNSGYAGRTGIFELLVPDEAVRDCIAASASADELRRLAAEAGMISLRADGLAKVKAGITTVEEVFGATAG